MNFIRIVVLKWRFEANFDGSPKDCLLPIFLQETNAYESEKGRKEQDSPPLQIHMNQKHMAEREPQTRLKRIKKQELFCRNAIERIVNQNETNTLLLETNQI